MSTYNEYQTCTADDDIDRMDIEICQRHSYYMYIYINKYDEDNCFAMKTLGFK